MAGGMNHFLKHAGMTLFFAVFTPNTSSSRVESALKKQIMAIAKNGISEEEIQKVKNIFLTNRTFDLFSTENICHHIGYSETVDGDYKIWVQRLDALEKVNRDQVITTINKYWRDELCHTLYLQPQKINPLLFALGIVRRIMPK
jgi:zinc protease